MTLALTTPAPRTRLGLAARDSRDKQKHQARPAGLKRAKRWVRWALTCVALVFGLVGFSAGSAQAFIWDDLEDSISSTMMNFCKPNDIPSQHTYQGMDSMVDLNNDGDISHRGSIKPDFSKDNKGKGVAGKNEGIDRLTRLYGGRDGTHSQDMINPTYERYGFSSLEWTSYGYDCMSSTTLMHPLSNAALDLLVKAPTMGGMAILNLAMDNTIYTAFASMISPFIEAMYAIFNPWIYVVAPLGIILTWIMSKGSLTATVKAGVWAVAVLGIFLFMSTSTSKITTQAMNLVTSASGQAACRMDEAANNRTIEQSKDTDRCSGTGMKHIKQALWYGIPYQTWHVGEVGETQAAWDEKAKTENKVGWGPAILNGNYLGMEVNDGDKDNPPKIDKYGFSILAATADWNDANYAPDSDESKLNKWGHRSWNEVPYLANVKVMCADYSSRDDDDMDASVSQRWMYSGSAGTTNEDGKSLYCDTDTAGTGDMVSNFKGEEYNKQLILAISGGMGALATVLAVDLGAVYLAFQKMMFYFLLFLAPVIMLISVFGDNKRRPFLWRYAELIGANLLKQVAAVCVVLFVSHAMSTLMDPSVEAWASVPWMLKPFVAVLFFMALVVLAFPLKNLLKGAVRGDTSTVDHAANAPARAAQATAKGAAIAGVAVGTAGAGLAATTSAGLAAKAGTVGKVGSNLSRAGRSLGFGSKAGQVLRGSGALASMGSQVLGSQASRDGKKQAVAQSAEALLNGPGSEKYRDNATGQLLPDAHNRAKKDAKRLADRGAMAGQSQQSQKAQMSAFFSGYRSEHGEYHEQDPSSPENKQKAQAKAEADKMQAQNIAQGGTGNKGPRPGGPNGSPSTGGTRRGAVAGASADQENTGQGHEGNAYGGAHAATVGSTASTGPNRNGTTSEANEANEAARVGTPVSGESQQGPSTDEWKAINAEYGQRARDNLSGPAFTRETEYKVAQVRSGDDVLHDAGLTRAEVMDNPTKTLLAGSAYNGGDTSVMDPFHPATQKMVDLRMATQSGDQDAIQNAVENAVNAVEAHGVPNQVSGVHAIGERAAQFEPVALVGAMPTITDQSSWQERAEAVQTMTGAMAAMPADYAARGPVQEYASALANPAVGAGQLDALKVQAVNAVHHQGGEAVPAAFAGAAAGSFFGEQVAPTAQQGQSGQPYAPANYESAQPAQPSQQQAPQAQPYTPEHYDASGAAPTPQAPAQSGNGAGISREDIREGVTEGMRDFGREYGGPAHRDNSSGGPVAGSGSYESGPVAERPTPSTPSGGQNNGSSVASFFSTPRGKSEPVEPHESLDIPEDGPIIYHEDDSARRRRNRRRRSRKNRFFGPTDDGAEDSGEGEEQ